MEPRPADQTKTTGASPTDAPSDGFLVERTLAGDRTQFDELIKRYQRQAVSVSYRLLGNTHDALEVTQDAFLKAFASLAALQNGDAFGGWLMRIVSNLSLNYRRSRKIRSQLPLDDLLGGVETGTIRLRRQRLDGSIRRSDPVARRKRAGR